MRIDTFFWIFLSLLPLAAAGGRKKDVPDDCRESTFAGQTDLDSPPISDCVALRDEMASVKRRYHVHYCGDPWAGPPSCYYPIIRKGSCQFAARNMHIEYPSTIGSWDIADILRDSINRFGKDGRVGAKGGQMPCKVRGKAFARPAIKIDWIITNKDRLEPSA